MKGFFWLLRSLHLFGSFLIRRSLAIFHFHVNINFHVFAKVLGKRDTIEVRATFAFIDGGDIEENEKHREHSCVRKGKLSMNEHGATAEHVSLHHQRRIHYTRCGALRIPLGSTIRTNAYQTNERVSLHLPFGKLASSYAHCIIHNTSQARRRKNKQQQQKKQQDRSLLMASPTKQREQQQWQRQHRSTLTDEAEKANDDRNDFPPSVEFPHGYVRQNHERQHEAENKPEQMRIIINLEDAKKKSQDENDGGGGGGKFLCSTLNDVWNMNISLPYQFEI